MAVFGFPFSFAVPVRDLIIDSADFKRGKPHFRFFLPGRELRDLCL